MSTIAEFGSWKSDITPDLFAKCNCKAINEMQVVGGNVYWTEQNATTGKRELYSKSIKKESEMIRWAKECSVSSGIYEYGGGSFHVLPDGSVLFSTSDGLFHQKSADAPFEKLTDGKSGKSRYSDFSATESHVFCVNERFLEDAKFPENQLISINRSTFNSEVVARGADFYASPRVSPNGKQLVWMEWSGVNMPWDETLIKRANVDEDGTSSNEILIKDGTIDKVNYMEPTWISEEKLLLINDSTNWWNLYEVTNKKYDARDKYDDENYDKNMCPIDREIGYPLWNLGFRNYARNSRYLVMNANGILYVRKLNEIHEIPTPEYTVFGYLSMDEAHDELFLIASGPKRASSLISINLADSSHRITVHRESRDTVEIEKLPVSVPEEFKFISDGVEVSGYFYPPENPAYQAPEGELPPVLLMGHGGPTAPAQNTFDLKKQFFTSRGIAIFDVNYRGSTGFGTDFRKMLYKNYGIVDRDDILNGAKALVEQGKVHQDKILITGSSSGGFLILSCLISPNNIIKGAVSLYGVADLLELDEDTHKFEQCYNELLVGKMPEEKHLYDERSPVFHTNKIETPIAFLHGKDDTVVPPQQSIQMYNTLRQNGVTTALVLYDGEGHGFRSGKVIRESSEATFYFLMKSIGIEPSIESDLEIVNAKH